MADITHFEANDSEIAPRDVKNSNTAKPTKNAKSSKNGFKSNNPDLEMRPARDSELPLVHQRLQEAIDTTADYTPQFRAYEKARLSTNYLANLHAVDPHHIKLLIQRDKVIGFMLSGPEFGTLWLYWSYIFPEFRRASLAMSFLPMFIDYWDNGRFHKISTYALPNNKIAVALMHRFKFEHTATIKQHMFGQDFILFEHELTKTEAGYDNGMNVGLKTRIKRQLAQWLGRAD